jgi:hypothetical protein
MQYFITVYDLWLQLSANSVARLLNVSVLMAWISVTYLEFLIYRFSKLITILLVDFNSHENCIQLCLKCI